MLEYWQSLDQVQQLLIAVPTLFGGIIILAMISKRFKAWLKKILFFLGILTVGISILIGFLQLFLADADPSITLEDAWANLLLLLIVAFGGFLLAARCYE